MGAAAQLPDKRGSVVASSPNAPGAVPSKSGSPSGARSGGKGFPLAKSAPHAAERFCIFCARTTPPVLARHAYVDCYRRALAGEPQYAPSALRNLELELNRREARTAALLARFEQQVERRKTAQGLLDQTVSAIKVLRIASDTPLKLDGNAIGIPNMQAPKSMRAASTLSLALTRPC